jgi:hypothetical protein
MHKEILTEDQRELLPLVKQFSKDFFLVGGTAIALHLGHRRSIDFDLFSTKPFKNADVRSTIRKSDFSAYDVIVNKSGEFTFLINRVKMTFFKYDFNVPTPERFNTTIRVPSLLDLAAMKAYALGQRSKWKDYVDLRFILKRHHSVREISESAKKLFGGEFNEKLFRMQLGYFDDINYGEQVEYMPGCEVEVDEETVKKELVEFATEA